MQYLFNQDEYDEYIRLKEENAELRNRLQAQSENGLTVDISLPTVCPTHKVMQTGVYERGKFEYVCEMCRREMSGAPDKTS